MPPKAKKAATTATTKTNTPTNNDKNDKQNDTTMTDTPAPAAAVVAKKTKTTKTATPEPVVEEKKAEIVEEKKADVAPVAKKGKKAVVEEKAAPVVEEKKVETPVPAAKKGKKVAVAVVEEKPAPVVVEEKKEEPKKVETPAPATKPSKAATKKAAAATTTTTTTTPVIEEKTQEKQQQPTTMTDTTTPTPTTDDAAPTKLSKNAAKKLKRQAAIAEKSLDAIEEVTIQSKIAEQTAAMDNTKKTPLWLATDDLRKAIRDGVYEEKGKKRALAIAQKDDVATKKTKLNDTTAKTTAGGENNNNNDDDDSDDEDTFNKNTDYGDDMVDVDEAGHQLVALTPALIKAAAVRTRDDDIMDDLVQQQREKHYLRRPIGGVGENKKTEEEEAEEKEKLERTVFLSNVPTIAKEKDIKDFIGRDIPIQSMRQRLAGFQDQKLPHWVALAKGQFHEKRDTLSWFVVLKNKSDMAQVLKLNQNVLLEKHIRVDAAAGEAKIDHTRAVFIGNLPYEVQEESLYQIFSKCGKIHAVRCLRDAKTGMGRGTAFVQFTDRVYVPEALKLNHKKFEQIGGRSIRVDRVAAQAYEKAPAFMLQLSKQRIMNEKRQKLEKLQGRSAKLRAAIMNVVDEPKAKVNTQGTYQKTFGLAAAGTKLKKPRHNMEGRTPKAPAPSWQGAAAKPSDKLGRNKASSTAKNAKDKKIKALKK